ncbi:MAG: DNA repair and recombination protein RadB [Thermoplasmata archaeon]|nr:DNA repair and recombination protein RadB [Thermoplasmata archaeon]
MARIPLDCPKFDRLLGGGIETGCVTLFYGEAGAGKTNVCLQAARAVAMQGGKVAYIDNEGLSSERLGQVFEGSGEAVKNLLISQVHSLEEQTDRIEKTGKLAENGVVSLVVIDSLTMFYRLRHDEPKARTEFVKQTELLLEIARKFDVAIIVTSQVYSNITSGRVEFLGGHALNHNAKTILRLEKLDNGRRKAVIVKHRSLPEGRSAYYRIVETGIEDA